MQQETSLGTRLRARRFQLGRTLQEVAGEAGLSLQYLSNLERGRGNPTLEVLQSLSKALEIPVTDLLPGYDKTSEGAPATDVLASAPASLVRFSRTKRFAEVTRRLADLQDVPEAELRERILGAMASAPRRSKGEPTEEDWRRLLDAFRLILEEG